MDFSNCESLHDVGPLLSGGASRFFYFLLRGVVGPFLVRGRVLFW